MGSGKRGLISKITVPRVGPKAKGEKKKKSPNITSSALLVEFTPANLRDFVVTMDCEQRLGPINS